MTRRQPYHAIVAALGGLTDAELYALVARAQDLLFDRLDATGEPSLLTVEVVAWDEAWMLAHYRALPQRAQRRLLQSLDGAEHDAQTRAVEEDGLHEPVAGWGKDEDFRAAGGDRPGGHRARDHRREPRG